MTMRCHARPGDESARPAEQDGQSMTYQLTALAMAVPAHEFPRLAVALAEIDTLGADAGATRAELSWLRGFPRRGRTNEVEI